MVHVVYRLQSVEVLFNAQLFYKYTHINKITH